jgi:hypothetical protein
VSADAVVVARGAIGSSELLLRSKVESQARIGAGFHLLGGVLVTAHTAEPVNAYFGVGLTSMLGGRTEYVMETFFAPPAAFAVSLNGFMGTHSARMQPTPPPGTRSRRTFQQTSPILPHAFGRPWPSRLPHHAHATV